MQQRLRLDPGSGKARPVLSLSKGRGDGVTAEAFLIKPWLHSTAAMFISEAQHRDR
jgi:hypothetical protein